MKTPSSVSRNAARSGFTLIELLVVIAIIAILAAILFPVFAQAREKARAIACLSDTKQLALGITQYEQDFDEKCPNGVNPYGGGQGWAGQIYPYVKSTGVFLCPDDPAILSGAGGTVFHPASYAYNSQVSIPAPNQSAGCASPGEDSLSIAAYNSPARTVLLAEVKLSTGYDVSQGFNAGAGTVANGDDDLQTCGGSPAGYGIGGAYDPSGYNSNLGTPGGNAGTMKWTTGYLRNARTGAALGDFDGPLGRHQGGANYVMADGHAKFFKPGAVSGGYYNATAGDCGNSTGPLAAATDCSDPTIGATFNTK